MIRFPVAERNRNATVNATTSVRVVVGGCENRTIDYSGQMESSFTFLFAFFWTTLTRVCPTPFAETAELIRDAVSALVRVVREGLEKCINMYRQRGWFNESRSQKH